MKLTLSNEELDRLSELLTDISAREKQEVDDWLQRYAEAIYGKKLKRPFNSWSTLDPATLPYDY